MSFTSRAAVLGAGLALLGALTAMPVVAATPVKTFLIVDDDNAATIGDGTNSAQCLDAITVPNVTFSTIGAATSYAAANSLDAVIYVCPGSYNESVTITSPVALRGPQALRPQSMCATRRIQATVTGAGAGPAITIDADHVTVSGLRVAGTRGSGIKVTSASEDVLIRHNVIANNAVGIELSGTAPLTVIQNCIKDNNNGGAGSGISQTADGLSGALIKWNRFEEHRSAAIDLKAGSSISDVVIRSNRSWNDKEFARLEGVSDVKVIFNATFQTDDISFGPSASNAAITVKGASSSVLVGSNRINTNHPRGISVDDPATGVTVQKNRLTNVGNGVVINTKQTGAVVVTDNTTTDILGTAFLVATDANGNTFTGNHVLGVANFACQDASAGKDGGSGTDGTWNTWTGTENPLGWASDPAGICPQTE